MKTLTILTASAMLLMIFFQCGGPATQEPPPVQPPAEEPTQPPKQPTSPPLTPTPMPEPTPPPLGLSPQNPVPLGHTLTASDGATITIHGITARGEEATREIKEWNMFNEEPSEGKEYVLVAGSVGYEGGEEETLSISPYLHFRAVVAGNIIDHATICCEENMLAGEMFPGGLIEGSLVFEVAQGVTDIVVIYTVLFEESYYFATQ